VAVNLEDTLPAGISVESVVLSQGTSQTAGGIVTCVLGTVGAGDSASVEINVRPHLTTTGIVTNSATVSTQTAESNSGNNSASEDTTIAQVLISAVPAPTDFGQADIDDGPSASMAITITNDGTQLLSFSGSEVEITGADSSEFQIASDTGENPLGPGTDRIVQVRFDPDSLGDKTAALTITSDARNAPSLEVPLMGIGEQFGPTGRSTRDIVGHILGIVTGPLAEFDVNMDGVVDAGDVVANIEAINAGP
jgi:hypothetical protein